MKANEYLSEEELLKKAIVLLTQKFGPMETSRFLSIVNTRRLESVKRHRNWQSKLDKDKLFKELF
jgi:phosphoketolase